MKCNGPFGNNAICSAAQSFCNTFILSPLPGIWDPYYVLTSNPDPFPPDLSTYLSNPGVIARIGNAHPWVQTNFGVYSNFASTGDWMRSSRWALEAVIDAGVRTVIYAGDADYIVNFMGVEAMVRARVLIYFFSLLTLLSALRLLRIPSLFVCVAQVDSLNTKYSADYAKQTFSTYTVGGSPAGVYKNAGKFSYLRVTGAGHEVPAYKWFGVHRGAASLQMFTQIMSDHQLSST